MIKKIVAIGPESTGKSKLCEQLAAHYGTAWCPEYARDYLTKNGMDYSFDDLLTIAKGQLKLEESVGSRQLAVGNKQVPTKDGHSRFTTRDSPVFIDTDMYVMKVWCEFVFGKCHRFILEQIVERKYDLYLLCNVDMPWAYDVLREYPDLESRRKLYSIYKDILINQDTPWADISGDYDERFQKAVNAVDAILK